jgi:nitrogen fixation NifU-like protein
MYSETVMDHFKNPRNVGVIEDADGVGEVGNPVCGDMMTFYIKVKENKIADIKFQTFGCGAAIAVSSMVSEMALGKTLPEASKITNRMVAEALQGLPKQKLHCSNLGADALQKAIKDYQAKTGGGASEAKAEGKQCYCPFCDIENPEESEICTGCGTDLKTIEDHHPH